MYELGFVIAVLLKTSHLMTVFCLTLSISGHLCMNDVSPESVYCTCDADSLIEDTDNSSGAMLNILIHSQCNVMMNNDASVMLLKRTH